MGGNGQIGLEESLETKRIEARRLSVAQHQGPRNTMEDAFQIVKSLTSFQGVPMSFYGVFDGHSGSETAEFCTQMLHEKIRESLTKVLKDDDKDVVGVMIREALHSAFLETHRE